MGKAARIRLQHWDASCNVSTLMANMQNLGWQVQALLHEITHLSYKAAHCLQSEKKGASSFALCVAIHGYWPA
eukprot:scaffold153859_cov20-Tisochrysis_lutea.AAC.1